MVSGFFCIWRPLISLEITMVASQSHSLPCHLVQFLKILKMPGFTMFSWIIFQFRRQFRSYYAFIHFKENGELLLKQDGLKDDDEPLTLSLVSELLSEIVLGVSSCNIILPYLYLVTAAIVKCCIAIDLNI